MCSSRCAPDSAVAARVLLPLRPRSGPRCGRCACAPPAALRTRLSLLGWGPPRSALSPATAKSGAQREEHTHSDRSGVRSAAGSGAQRGPERSGVRSAAGGAHAQRQPSPERSGISTRAATCNRVRSARSGVDPNPATAESGAQRDQHTRSDRNGVRSAAGSAHAQRPQRSPERSGISTRAATATESAAGAQREEHTRSNRSRVRCGSAAGGAHAQRPQRGPLRERSGRSTRAATAAGPAAGAQQEEHTRSDRSGVRSAAGGAHAQRPQRSPERRRQRAQHTQARRRQRAQHTQARRQQRATSATHTGAAPASRSRRGACRRGACRRGAGNRHSTPHRGSPTHSQASRRRFAGWGGGGRHRRYAESRAQRTQRPANYPWAPGAMACVHAHTKSSSWQFPAAASRVCACHGAGGALGTRPLQQLEVAIHGGVLARRSFPPWAWSLRPMADVSWPLQKDSRG